MYIFLKLIFAINTKNFTHHWMCLFSFSLHNFHILFLLLVVQVPDFFQFIATLNMSCVFFFSTLEDRMSIIGGHLTAVSESSDRKASQIPVRTRPPITTHVLDVSQGSPASGVEVRLEVWKGTESHPSFSATDIDGWSFVGCSTTNKDGRSGQLMSMVDALNPGTYRISFNTGKYCPGGFFPYVSIVFEIQDSQKWEHFHVPLLLSPFSFTTYRGS